jgi:hypothetical protein
MSIVHNDGASALYGLSLCVICAALGMAVTLVAIFAHTAHAANTMWVVGL